MRKWHSSHLRLTPEPPQARHLEGLEVLIKVNTAMNFTGLGSFQHLLTHSHLRHFTRQLCLIHKSPVQVNVFVHEKRKSRGSLDCAVPPFQLLPSARDERAEGEKEKKKMPTPSPKKREAFDALSLKEKYINDAP